MLTVIAFTSMSSKIPETPDCGPKLFIGPWVGEFGVEVLRWQNLARMLAKSQHWSEIIVATHPDRFFLYEDFATKFIPYSPPTPHTLGHTCKNFISDDLHLRFIDPVNGDVLFSPHVEIIKSRVMYALSACRGIYRNLSLGSPIPESRYDVLIHARGTAKASQKHKNWPDSDFHALVTALPKTLKIASIGSRDGAHKIAGTDDLRGIALKNLAGYCGLARVIIGPSSGTIHFAMHCGTPALTWIGNDERSNYYPQWNPLNAPICCIPGWQPRVKVVLHKFHELLAITESRRLPIEYIVVGTKRSGNHGVITWLTRLDTSVRFTHWNDCVRKGMMSFPHEDFELPTEESMPKELHRHAVLPCIFRRNPQGRHSARILSYEGLSIEKCGRLPEATSAKRLIFVLRDAANLTASLKKGIPRFKQQPFLHPEMQGIIDTYRGYLLEAVGRTNYLGSLRRKAVFVSYNLWHSDAHYRRNLSQQLGKGQIDPDRGLLAESIYGSGFESNTTPAKDLNTLDRWKEFMEKADFWNLSADAELYDAECAFHGVTTPLASPLPIISGNNVS